MKLIFCIVPNKKRPSRNRLGLLNLRCASGAEGNTLFVKGLDKGVDGGLDLVHSKRSLVGGEGEAKGNTLGALVFVKIDDGNVRKQRAVQGLPGLFDLGEIDAVADNKRKVYVNAGEARGLGVKKRQLLDRVEVVKIDLSANDRGVLVKLGKIRRMQGAKGTDRLSVKGEGGGVLGMLPVELRGDLVKGKGRMLDLLDDRTKDRYRFQIKLLFALDLGIESKGEGAALVAFTLVGQTLDDAADLEDTEIIGEALVFIKEGEHRRHHRRAKRAVLRGRNVENANVFLNVDAELLVLLSVAPEVRMYLVQTEALYQKIFDRFVIGGRYRASDRL